MTDNTQTNTWHHELSARGAQWDEQGLREFAGQAKQPAGCQLFALDALGCLVVEGPEARRFLQGQVTCDVNLIAPDHGQRGAHCNTKGRMVFSFIAVQLPSDTEGSEAIALLIPRGLMERARQALAKFIVFSKAELSPRDDLRALGLSGPRAAALLGEMLPRLPIAPEDVVQGNGGLALRIGGERFLCLLPDETALSQWQSWAPQSELCGYQQWNLADIRAGLGQVVPGTEEMFIPQMLNMHLTGGISFKKGCYVGQEVVARMQYLGKLKRHMRRLQLTEAEAGVLPAAGTALFSRESNQSVGNVVVSAPNDEGRVEMLAVTTDAAFESESLYLDAEHSQKLQPLPLPYAIT